jgi:ribosomal protein S18 acetylase RimI-like enzyme
MIRRAINKDIKDIVYVHKKAFSSVHFTSFFSEKLLVDYYQYFLSEPNYIFVFEYNGEIQGFIVVGVDIPNKLTLFKKEKLFDIILTTILHPKAAIKKIISDIFYNFNDTSLKYIECSFLLLSIATIPYSKGVGKKLMTFLDEFSIENNLENVGLYVRVQNISAIQFYLNHHFKIKGYSKAQYYLEKNIIK